MQQKQGSGDLEQQPFSVSVTEGLHKEGEGMDSGHGGSGSYCEWLDQTHSGNSSLFWVWRGGREGKQRLREAGLPGWQSIPLDCCSIPDQPVCCSENKMLRMSGRAHAYADNPPPTPPFTWNNPFFPKKSKRYRQIMKMYQDDVSLKHRIVINVFLLSTQSAFPCSPCTLLVHPVFFSKHTPVVVFNVAMTQTTCLPIGQQLPFLLIHHHPINSFVTFTRLFFCSMCYLFQTSVVLVKPIFTGLQCMKLQTSIVSFQQSTSLISWWINCSNSTKVVGL